MRAWVEANRSGLLIAAMTTVGFGFTLYVFYPGVMTTDARYVYQDIAKGFFGDWQSPVMTLVWSWIDPVAPGPGSLLLLTVTLYWLAFGLLALTVARRSPWLALLLLLLALSPPAFIFVGIIWRDVLFAAAWLLAGALAFAVAGHSWKARVPVQAVGLALLAFGLLIRPNALPAAPILATYILWPSRFYWKRAVIFYLPIAAGLYGLVHLVYYDVLDAKRQHPLHSIMIFDLGGISHFAKENVFPGAWSPEETALITGGCYKPVAWDVYWTLEPCKFVMARLEGTEKIFGSPALFDAWKAAILNHPFAYLRHRATFMWAFLADTGLTMWTLDLDDPSKIAFSDNSKLMTLKAVHDVLKPTPLFLVGTWLMLNIGLCLRAWPRRGTSQDAFVLGVCGSAAVYVMTFSAIGIATDFRYGLWAVLAGLVGMIISAQRRNDLAAH